MESGKWKVDGEWIAPARIPRAFWDFDGIQCLQTSAHEVFIPCDVRTSVLMHSCGLFVIEELPADIVILIYSYHYRGGNSAAVTKQQLV